MDSNTKLVCVREKFEMMIREYNFCFAIRKKTNTTQIESVHCVGVEGVETVFVKKNHGSSTIQSEHIFNSAFN